MLSPDEVSTMAMWWARQLQGSHPPGVFSGFAAALAKRINPEAAWSELLVSRGFKVSPELRAAASDVGLSLAHLPVDGCASRLRSGELYVQEGYNKPAKKLI